MFEFAGSVRRLAVSLLFSQAVLAGPLHLRRQTDFFSIQTSPPDPPSSSSAPFFGFPSSSSTIASSVSSQQQPIFPSSSTAATSSPSGIASSTSSAAAFPAPTASLLPGQDIYDSKRFLIYNADEVHYPFTVHLPDRATRGLYPLPGPWPLILNLGGSGARGPASEAETVSRLCNLALMGQMLIDRLSFQGTMAQVALSGNITMETARLHIS